MVTELNCTSCKRRVPLNTMKYAKDGSGLICEECLDKQVHGVNIKIKPKPIKKYVETSRKKKVSYTCKSCSFRFSRAIDFRGPKNCPNCGKDKVAYNLPNDADELLRELEKMDDV